MKYLLYIFSVLAFFAGFSILSQAKGAIHETESFVLFLISAVFFSSAAIVGAINGFSPKREIDTPDPKTHMVCPDCKEFVRIGALVCRHCGVKLETV
jgi:hypothetical protein